MLSLQSAQLTDESALAAMQTSHSRVRSMALLHQNLYQGHRFTTVDMEAYVDQLIDGISEIYGLDEDHRIQIDNEVFEIELDVDVAAPVGLVINELVTNAIKYAFPGERTGRITIDLREAEGEEIVLEVADDGVGIGQAEPSVESTCFGTRLLGILAKKLSGTLEIEDRLGTRVRLSFPAVSPLHSTLVGARPFDVPADEENHRDDGDDVE